ncbi:unnamed protein product, partial [Mesorhabditis belari]|uniref:F-box domain-containing protein n=1 Tax=Mesorhabditis belari TaxID=2138241 RepID=A0AAF3ESK8_9BILA
MFHLFALPEEILLQICECLSPNELGEFRLSQRRINTFLTVNSHRLKRIQVDEILVEQGTLEGFCDHFFKITTISNGKNDYNLFLGDYDDEGNLKFKHKTSRKLCPLPDGCDYEEAKSYTMKRIFENYCTEELYISGLSPQLFTCLSDILCRIKTKRIHKLIIDLNGDRQPNEVAQFLANTCPKFFYLQTTDPSETKSFLKAEILKSINHIFVGPAKKSWRAYDENNFHYDFNDDDFTSLCEERTIYNPLTLYIFGYTNISGKTIIQQLRRLNNNSSGLSFDFHLEQPFDPEKYELSEKKFPDYLSKKNGEVVLGDDWTIRRALGEEENDRNRTHIRVDRDGRSILSGMGWASKDLRNGDKKYTGFATW